MKLTVTASPEDFAKGVEMLSPARAARATRLALNRTLTNLRARVAKETGQHVRLKAAYIKTHLKEDKATNTALTAALRVTFDAVSLRQYPHRQTRRGLSVSTLRGEGRKRIRDAFIGTALGGSLYRREGPKVTMSKGRYQGKQRQQISKLHGPSVRSVAKPIIEELHASGWIDERLVVNLVSSLNHALDPKGSKGSA